ncbi:Nuclease SbcCD subunit C [compost metagenome]
MQVELRSAEEGRADLLQRIDALQVRHDQQRSGLQADLAEFGYSLPEDGALWLDERKRERDDWQRANALLQQLMESEREAEAALQAARSLAAEWLERWQALGQEALAAEPGHAQPQQALAESQAQLSVAQRQADALAGGERALVERLEQGHLRLADLEAGWERALQQSPFADLAAFRAALLEEPERQRLAELDKRLHTALTEAATLRSSASQAVQCLQAEPHGTLTLDELDAQLMALGTELRELGQRQGEIRAQLQGDDTRRASQQSLFTQIQAQEQEHDLWQRLNSLIGSADGARYRRFAQGLTLDHLVHLANRQLQRLHGRYQLARRSEGELELEVIDTWQGDSARDCKTLSGGESFLVSLALALALSDLVSHKTSIDSLFLDEGFGTLDGETLEVALDALDSLNASGKTIGVISHVEAMKERIPVQLKVHKGVGMGYSRLDACFAVKP